MQEDDFVETFPYYESAGELQETMEYLLQLRLLLKKDDEMNKITGQLKC